MNKHQLLQKFLFCALVLTFFFAINCKDDPPTGGGVSAPTIGSFTATPTSVAAGGDSVLLSWQVTGATTLSISPIVGNVTPLDNGSKKVFVNATTTFTLTATNANGSVTANAIITISTPTTFTINGFVKDMDGEPIGGVPVIVKGKTTALTNANGGFSVPNVTLPYDVTLVLTTQKVAVTYQALTSTSPTLQYLSSLTTSKSATISGNVPAAVGKTTSVFFISGKKAWSTTANAATGAYTFIPSWKGSANSYTGKLYVLRWTTNTSGLPSEYDGFSSKDLTISAGGNFSSNNFLAADLTDPAEQNINGSINLPTSSYQLKSKSLYLHFGDAYVYLGGESSTSLTTDFSYTVPTISGTTFEIDANAEVASTPTNRLSSFWKMGIIAGTNNINITLADAPKLNFPAHNGTNIDTTNQFLWAFGGATGVYLTQISPTGGSNPSHIIFTPNNSLFIPNLNPQGLALPSNAEYQWNSILYYPLSINDCATDNFIPFTLGNAGDRGYGQSETFKFRTKP